MSYPIPDGCPEAKDYGEAWVGESGWAEMLEAKLLDGEVSTALPEGGCAYAEIRVSTAESSAATYRRVLVWYFNLGEPGKRTVGELTDWARGAGGTPSALTMDGVPTGELSDSSLSLPDTFSGWSGSAVSWVDGETSYFWPDDEFIPEYTQGASAKIEFVLASERVDAVSAAGNSGTSAVDPTTALANGLAASYSNSFNITNKEGYTALVQMEGRLQPFTSDVAKSAPGKFQAISSASTHGSATNTTADRNTETTGLSIVALYPLKTAACNGNSGISVEGGDWQDSSYCMVRIGNLGAAELSPDGVQDLESPSANLTLGPFDETGDALAQLNAPISIYAIFGGRGTNLTGVNWTGDQGCHVQSRAGGTWAAAMHGWPEVLCK